MNGYVSRKQGYDIPVVLIVFNRPDLAERQFQILKEIKPQKLYVVADAPRAWAADDKEKTKRVREIFFEIPWECDIKRIYAEENMGCDRRVVSGLNEVFAREEYAVILEDDCLPHISFFDYCRELLLKYQDESEIMYISGTKQVPEYKMPYSYSFSYNISTWGWATWKRAWQEWHWDEREWNEKKQDWMKGIYSDKYRWDWIKDVEKYFSKESIPWDYVWQFCVGRRFSIVPAVNLIENAGFGADATHTKVVPDGYEGKAEAIGELQHPPKVEADLEYPRRMEQKFKNTLYRRVKRKIRRMIKREGQ